MATFHVIYHSPCADGCFAAFAASLWFENAGIDPLGERIRWCPMEVFKPPDQQFDAGTVQAGDEVFFLDYTGEPKFVLGLAERCARCTVLDHHETGLVKLREELLKVTVPSSLRLVLDVNRSGATIALDYFSSRPSPERTSSGPEEPPSKRQRTDAQLEWTSDYSRLFRDEEESKRLLRVFRLIEDADIWNWWLEGSKDFHAGFAALRLDMNPATNPELFSTLRALRVEDIMKKGAEDRIALERAIAEEMKGTFELQIAEAGGVRCLGVMTERGDLRSALGHQVAVKSQKAGMRGFGCVCYAARGLPEGKVKCSVRAVEGENSLDVTEKFGGGGHKGASSCNVDVAALEKWKTAATHVSAP